MREDGLRAVGERRFRVTTKSDPTHPVAENLLDRHFPAQRPNEVCVSDITDCPPDGTRPQGRSQRPAAPLRSRGSVYLRCIPVPARSERHPVQYEQEGQCWDNAVAESFFATLEKELIEVSDWHTRAEARRDIFAFIESWYNRQRRHSSLGYRTPAEYEERAALPQAA
jgi:putative transposase